MAKYRTYRFLTLDELKKLPTPRLNNYRKALLKRIDCSWHGTPEERDCFCEWHQQYKTVRNVLNEREHV